MSEQRKQSFPCLICGRILLREMDDYEAQPDSGVMCSTSGNYGSTVFDPMNGERIYFNICDECFKKAGSTGALQITIEAVPITTSTIYMGANHEPKLGRPSIVGYRRTDRPFVPWHPGMARDDATENMEIEEIIEHFDSEQFKWNLTLEGYQFIKQELDEYDAQQEAADGE